MENGRRVCRSDCLNIDPRDERRQRRRELSLGELMEKYMERHAKPHKKSWKYDERIFNRYLTHWTKRRLSSFSRDDFEDLHKRIGKDRGQIIANRLITLIKTMFNMALDWGDFNGESPARGVKKFRENRRDRYVTRSEMPRFMSALDKYPTPTSTILLKSLYLPV